MNMVIVVVDVVELATSLLSPSSSGALTTMKSCLNVSAKVNCDGRRRRRRCDETTERKDEVKKGRILIKSGVNTDETKPRRTADLCIIQYPTFANDMSHDLIVA